MSGTSDASTTRQALDAAQAATAVGDTTEPPPSRSNEPRIDVPERYLGGDELGRGGMGVVQTWSDPHIGREVAAKILLRDDPLSRRRFLHEARTQGSLAHPSIVPVYDLAVLDGGRPFFTMQRVKGETLASVFARPTWRFSMRKLLEALARMALAVDFAHARGVIHRDLKPANLMLGDFGEVYVLDWGIARHMADRVSIVPGAEAPTGNTDEVLGLTATGTLLGTPGYMSPEQARGDQATIDARSDVYALGCVLFDILAGERLHDGTRLTELVLSTLDGATDRSPARRAPTRDIPPELDALCLAATDPDASARLDSVRALADGLERYLEGDRDVELRMKAAQEHARRAAGLANVALGKSRSAPKTDGEMIASRQKALAEIGRAVALVPEHPVALAALVALLTEPPKRTPDEVRTELEDLRVQHVRVGGRAGAAGYGAAAALLMMLLAIGLIPMGWMPIASLLLLITASSASLAFARMARPDTWTSVVMMIVSTLALGSLTTLFGPLIATPTIIAVNAMIFLVSNERALRRWILLLGAIGVVLPLALEAFGLVPPSFRFEAGTLVLLPRAMPFEPASLIVLAIVFVATVVLGAVTLGPFRDDLDRALLESRVLAWQLRQFVPTQRKNDAPRE